MSVGDFRAVGGGSFDATRPPLGPSSIEAERMQQSQGGHIGAKPVTQINREGAVEVDEVASRAIGSREGVSFEADAGSESSNSFSGIQDKMDNILGNCTSPELQVVRLVGRFFNEVVVSKVKRDDINLICNFLDSLKRDLDQLLTPEAMMQWPRKVDEQEKKAMLAVLSISNDEKAKFREGASLATHKADISRLRDPIIEMCKSLPIAELEQLRDKYSGKKLPFLFQNLFSLSIIYNRLAWYAISPRECCEELLRIGEIDKALLVLDVAVPAVQRDGVSFEIALACVGMSQFFIRAKPTKRQIEKALAIANQIEHEAVRGNAISHVNIKLACFYVREGSVDRGLGMLERIGETASRHTMDYAYLQASHILFDNNPDADQALAVAAKIIGKKPMGFAIRYICTGLCKLNKYERALDVAKGAADFVATDIILRDVVKNLLDLGNMFGAMKLAFLVTDAAKRKVLLSAIAFWYGQFDYRARQKIVEGLTKTSTDQELECMIDVLRRGPNHEDFYGEYIAQVFINKNLHTDEISQKVPDLKNKIFDFMCLLLVAKGDFTKAVAVRNAIDSERVRASAHRFIFSEFHKYIGRMPDAAVVASVADACSRSDVRELISKLESCPHEELFGIVRRQELNFFTYLLVHKKLNYRDFLSGSNDEVFLCRIAAAMPWALSMMGKFTEAIEAVNALSTSKFVSEAQLAKDIDSAFSDIVTCAVAKGHEPAQLLALIDMCTSSNAWKKSVAHSRQDIADMQLDKFNNEILSLKAENEKEQLQVDCRVYRHISKLLWFKKSDLAEVCVNAIKTEAIKKRAQELVRK